MWGILGEDRIYQKKKIKEELLVLFKFSFGIQNAL